MATTTDDLPEAYVIPEACERTIENLEAHGIIMERIERTTPATAKRFLIESVETADRPNQGQVTLDITGNWVNEETSLEAGSFMVPLRQPLARLIPVLLEPDGADSLVRWGFFTSWIVPQWSRGFNPYPVLRLDEIPDGIQLRAITP